MVFTYAVGEDFQHISGPERDEFLNTLCELSESDEQEIVLDLDGVCTMGSIALAAIGKMNALLRSQNRFLRLKGLSPHLYQVFAISGFTELMDIEKPSQP